MVKEKPKFDGYESLSEMIDWICEPIDIQERGYRLIECSSKSKGFDIYIKQVFTPSFKFEDTLSYGKFDVKSKKLGRWGYVPFSLLMKNLHRYCDSSTMLKQFRFNQLLGELDDIYPPDTKYISDMLFGDNATLPDKLNHKVFALAFPELLGEGAGQSTVAESH